MPSLLAVGLAAVFLANASAREISTVALDASTCHFFSSFNDTSTELLALADDGRYLMLDVEHMLTAVNDHGYWRQRPDGVVELASEAFCRDPESDLLSLSLPQVAPGEQARAIEPVASNTISPMYPP